ncbi:alpha-2-macroglobulin family protein [Dysgonomonas macrotermitis]|uniref:Alpha-2-macroglobulin family N-terminal region n=1 Tax=Dysgonomonas macrotermitis TaxID=1346286 RepID=A0A1M5BCE2_9BACT|nr:alpha-2-macroglobulin family protein [Dysgonomonas macrotermitis]SHF40046.1 Alpha-2-macroglobulin family N-terminal region [Dysgonomonas macrotermitis]
MKRQLFLGLLIFLTIGIFAQTNQPRKEMNRYETRWNEIAGFEKDDLPKSALGVANQILKSATSEQNIPQTIKALIYINKYQVAIDGENNTRIFSDIDSLINVSKKAEEKALLHSMIAELYLNYYDVVRWTINSRTDLSGYVPADMREWTQNIFKEKAVEHLRASLTSEVELVKVQVDSYGDILIEGKDSRRVYPTLFDFLVKRAVDQSKRLNNSYRGNQSTSFTKALSGKNIKIADLALPTSDFVKLDFSGEDELLTLDFYTQALRSFSNRKMNEAVVYTEIDRNSYLMNTVGSYGDKYALPFLLDLEKKNTAYEYDIDVIKALTDQLQRNFKTEEEKNENLKQVYDWCQLGISRYANSDRIGLLKDVLNNIESSYARIEGAAIYHPDTKNKALTIYYRNLKSVTIKVVDKKTKETVKAETIALTPKTTYSEEKQEVTLDLSRLGSYELALSFDKPVSNSNSNNKKYEFGISRLANFNRRLSSNKYEFYVVDRISGAPVSGATINIRKLGAKNEYTVVDQVQTDAKGFATYDLTQVYDPQKGNIYQYTYTVSKGDDVQDKFTNFSYSYEFASAETPEGGQIVNIFTDRSIYRPGQTVYFKAISLIQGADKKYSVNKNKQSKVTLYNVNNQVIAEKNLRSNDFGSISGEFILPQGGLTGQYYIEVDNNSSYFRVEEYKRPTFEITFDKIEKAYAFGDKVTLVGHAENFSGVKLQGAEVSYTVNQIPYMRWWYGSGNEVIENSSVTTKEDGSFEITFTVPKPETTGNRIFGGFIYNYQIEASVTDQNGETQSGVASFVVGDVSLQLYANIPYSLDKASTEKIVVKSTNLNGQDVSVTGKYTIYSLLPNDSIKAEIKKGEFTSESTDIMEVIRTLPSAKYKLTFSAKDDKGREVNGDNTFVLYSYNDTRPPVESNEWLVTRKRIFGPGQNAEVALGISATDITVLYEILNKNKVFERKQIKFSNKVEKFSIPYKAEYGDGVTVSFTYIVNEKPYNLRVDLVKEESVKDLKLKMEVFRDKLRPGQKEEWRISVKDNQGKPALTELLASMYDSSLDKLSSPNVWNFVSETYKGYYTDFMFQRDATFNPEANYIYFDRSKSSTIKSLSFDRLDWFGFNFYNSNNGSIRIRGMSSATPAPAPMMAKNSAVTDALYGTLGSGSVVLAESAVVAYDESSPQQAGGVQPTVQVRSNFNETAFFYPQLRTDENGETIISFTVPESNTSWKFRALAYDKDLNSGTLEALAVSRKELMVTPNIPRFMRQGDKASISTKISNLSEQVISGKVRLEFFDPLTEQIKNVPLTNQYQDFSLEKDASGSVTWTFNVPEDIDMLGCRIIAESGSFSDGEQHAVPVLSNRMLVTESMTMYLNGGQTKDFVFDKLVNNKSNSLTNYRLTLEYTGNPAWYAVQTLPVLSNPTNENAVNWFASYYVNTLGSYIMHQYPKVANMITAWKRQGADKESMISNLMKNEELKTVLLEETPWVLDAKNETEQMERLSLLLDMNNTTNQTQQAISKLKELQMEDGGWSWYKGMQSNRSMTQYILYGFSQLVHLNAVQYGEEERIMQMSAIKYIDKQILDDFTTLKKYDKDWKKLSSISINQLEYVYVRSFYRDIPIDQQTREAERFYTSVAEKSWTDMNLYQRSLLAVLAIRNGNKVLNQKIMKSVREHATISDEMGMFWANNNSKVFMNQSAVTVHTFLMEAFKESGSQASELDLMKQWLLKQKQTQLWESTHATIDAVYALLSTGSDWFTTSSESVIKLNNTVIDSKNNQLGSDYIKESWGASEISSGMGKVNISKAGNGPAWGAMYWQYYEDLNKINQQAGELNVSKTLFVEESTANGKALKEVNDNNPLKVGDKVIVRLIVKVDRDMEFVQLKDMRASCFEPVETLSGIQWQNATYYYRSTKDASTNFYFDHLAKGAYVFEYPVYVNRVGEYSNGITTVQCMYAPEFVAHTAGFKVIVK